MERYIEKGKERMVVPASLARRALRVRKKVNSGTELRIGCTICRPT